MTERAFIVLIICTALVLLFLIEKVTEYQKDKIRSKRWERRSETSTEPEPFGWVQKTVTTELTEAPEDEIDIPDFINGLRREPDES